MLKDITIGQFYPGRSVVHKLDPRIKILMTLLYIVLIFLLQSLWGYVGMGAFLFVSIYLSQLPLKYLLKGLKPILPLILFTFVLNVFFTAGETMLWQWGILKLSVEGIVNAAFLAVRLMLLVLTTSLMTLTTSPIALTDGIERLLNPLKRLRFPVHELAMMMTIALRFIPTLLEETDRIMKAQQARGADFESGKLMQRARSLVPLLVPLFVSAFRRADDLAMAMEARCYHGGEGRTRMKVLHMGRADLWAGVAGALMTVWVIADRLWLVKLWP